MTLFINKELTFIDLCRIQEVIFFIDKSILEQECVIAVCKRPECEQHEFTLIIKNGKIIRCFLSIEFMVSGYRIDCTKPSLFYPNNFDDAYEKLEKSQNIVEVHWLKNKCKIESMNIEDGLPNLNNYEKLNLVEN